MNRCTLFCSLLLTLLPGTGQATTVQTSAAAQPVRVELVSLLVGQDAKGQETLTPTTDAARPRPGDLLSWKATAINTLKNSVSNLALTIPIPATTTYLNGSATLKIGGAVVKPSFSLDGKTFAPAPLKRKVSVTKNGLSTTQEVVVPPNEYRAVRWTLPTLAAGSQVQAEVRTSVR